MTLSSFVMVGLGPTTHEFVAARVLVGGRAKHDHDGVVDVEKKLDRIDE